MNMKESVSAIMESGDGFGSIFYEVFFDRCPEARKLFDGVDMGRQSVILTMAMKLMEQYQANGFKAIEQYLQYVGTRHKDVSVPREMYPEWRDAMLITLERFHGEDWNESLAADWRRAIDASTEVMFRGYDERGGV